MECKDRTIKRIIRNNTIKVEPYWNVKSIFKSLVSIWLIIKVEPYWNVKESKHHFIDVEKVIKVEPYWNVKTEANRRKAEAMRLK